MQQLITVATFNDRPSAEKLSQRLSEAGLNSEVLDESSAQQMWFFTGSPRAHMRVRVPKTEGDRAQQFLKDLSDEDDLMRLAVTCPECGSSRVEYPQFSRRSGLSFFFALLAAVRLLDRQYYCRSCHFTWVENPKVEKEVDILNWPKK
jgi:hypothetical protein